MKGARAAAISALAVLWWTGCGGDPASPAPPTTPAPPPPPPEPLPFEIGLRLQTPFAAAPGEPIVVEEGGTLYAEIAFLGEEVQNGNLVVDLFPDLELRIVTDAAPGQLRFPDAVTPLPPLFGERGLTYFLIEVAPDAVEEEAAGPYSLRLAPLPDETLPPEVTIVEQTIRLSLVDSPPASCGATLSASITGTARGMVLGQLSLSATHPATSLHLWGPYVGQIETRPTPTGFNPDDIRLTRLGDGFRITTPMRWASWVRDVDLEMRVPGCRPVRVVCDDRSCSS